MDENKEQQAQTENKQQVTEDKPAESNGKKEDSGQPQLYPLQTPTGTIEVTAQELLQLASFGAGKLAADREAKEKEQQPEKEEEFDAETQITKLNEQIQSLKKEKETEKELVNIRSLLSANTEKFERLKNEPELAAAVNAIALSKWQTNPRFGLEHHHNETAKVIEKLISKEVEKEKEKIKGSVGANRRILNMTNSTVRSSGVPTLDKEKKYTPEDIRSGAARRAFEDFLAKSGA